MIQVQSCEPLFLEDFLLDNVHSASYGAQEHSKPEPHPRLSTSTFRLSFGDADQARRSNALQIPPVGETVKAGTIDGPLSRNVGLSKHDVLLLNQLFCTKNRSDVIHDEPTAGETKDRAEVSGNPLRVERGVGENSSRTVDYRIRVGSTGSNCEEDELVVIWDNVLLRGNGLDSKYRTVKEIHTVDDNVVDAVWCTFCHHSRFVKPEHATKTPALEPFSPVETFCVATQKKLNVYRSNGETYAHSVAFPIRKLWSFQLGLLVERDQKVASNLTSVSGYPNLFSACGHLEEVAPVLFLGDAEAEESMTLLIHPDSEIVAASQELPLVLIFEPAKNLHSLWFARYSTACEIDKVVEGVKTQKPGGESLHFHPDFVSSPKMVSKCHFGGHGSSSMSFPISPIASSPSVKPGAVLPDSAKRGSLHRDVLLSASGKYPFPDGSSFTPTSSLTNPLRQISPHVVANGTETPQNGVASTHNRSNLAFASPASLSAVISSDMSLSLSKSATFGPAMSFSHSLPGVTQLPPATPTNISAHSLKDLRSAAMSFSQSKVMSLVSNEANSPSFRRHSRSTSAQHSHGSARKFTRTHSQPYQVITDELAIPKLAFVHLWSDTSSYVRQKAGTDGFLVQDCFKQMYFCFVLPTQQVLRCLKLKRDILPGTGLTRISFNSVSNIPAVSAVKIGSGDFMVVLNPSKVLRLFSGPSHPLVRIDFSSAAVLPMLNHGPAASSPVVSRTMSSSVLSPHFSPVPDNTTTPRASSASDLNILRLVPCSGNKFVIECSEGPKIVRMPHRRSSDMIELCLEVLRECLAEDLYGSIFTEVMKLSLDLTSKMLELRERWEMFFTGMLIGLGCSVTRTPRTSKAALTDKSFWQRFQGSAASVVFRRKFGITQADVVYVPDDLLISADRSSAAFAMVDIILLCLHLVYEESRLCCLWAEERKCMVSWLAVLSQICEQPSYSAAYRRGEGFMAINAKVTLNGLPCFERRHLPEPPPDLMSSIAETVHNRCASSSTFSKYPVIPKVNTISRNILALMTELMKPAERSSHKVVAFLHKSRLSFDIFQFMPLSLQTALQQLFGQLCDGCAFETLPTIIYQIGNRKDALMCRQAVEGRGFRDFSVGDVHRRTLVTKTEVLEGSKKKTARLPHSMITKCFVGDARVREAEKLLLTSEPVTIPLNAMHSNNEVEFRKAQESWLKSVAPRTMSLPVARGMLALRTEFAYATEKLVAPEIVYSGLERGTGRKVSLKNEELPQGHDFWPRFHNGVATGLRLRHYDQDAIKFDHHWLAFNSAQYTKRESVDYAGIFLGMALNGLIDIKTDPVDLHNMLIRLEDCVSVAVILGMACVNRGTQDKRYFHVTALHIVSLIEDSSVELLIPQNIYVASLLSLGLLYCASANRYISERLLGEIWTGSGLESESGAQPASTERESSSLAAAIGLGFVLLGLGNESVLGLADLEISQRLRIFMVGGLHGKASSNSRRAEFQTAIPVQRSRDDDQAINIHITAPGAILALAMIYMKTERRDIAEWMVVPSTLQELDEIRPDFLLLRVTAKSLIMWDTVEPTEKWVSSNFPVWILKNIFRHSSELEKEGLDVVSITQGYFFILAGCCMSLGLKFAGTALPAAKTLLMSVSLMMTKWAEDPNLTRRCSQTLTQTCLTTILIALASVMAGTGDLEVFRLLRYMHGRTGGPRSAITYGHQMGVHMAIGLLFLGCGMYTLGTSNEAVAAMLISFYPLWPKTPSDNRYHLQAFRHLYILAVENRRVMARSVHGGLPVQASARVTFHDRQKPEQEFVTPCVLPELSAVKGISFRSGHHWLNFSGADGWTEFRKLLLNGGLVVMPSNRKQGKKCPGKDWKENTLLLHVERFISRPNDDSAAVIKSMDKFCREFPVLCLDKTLAALFSVVERNWLKRSVEDQWIPWLLYECVSYDDSAAFMEILAWSKEKVPAVSKIASLILRRDSRDVQNRPWKWKVRLIKKNFLKLYNDVPGENL